MAKLPKAYIKKYGISKRAWAEYRKHSLGGTSVGNHRYVSRKRVSPYKARAKKSRGRKSAKKTVRRKKNMSFNFGGSLGKGVVAGVAAGVVNQFIPVNIAGVDLIIAGMLMKDSTCQKIGAVTLGRNLAGSLTGLLGVGGNTQNAGGGY